MKVRTQVYMNNFCRLLRKDEKSKIEQNTVEITRSEVVYFSIDEYRRIRSPGIIKVFYVSKVFFSFYNHIIV